MRKKYNQLTKAQKRRRIDAALRWQRKNKKRVREMKRDWWLRVKNTLGYRKRRRKACKQWRAKNKEQQLQYQREYRAKNHQKWLTRKRLEAAVRVGTIKPQSCSECGNKKAQAHHEDYRKPFAVIWLCPLCHADRHRKAA